METGEEMKLHPREIKEVYQRKRNEQLEQLNQLLIQHQVDLINVDIDRGFDEVLLQYLIKRKKIF